jgi:membrane fusion protein (multidrug efflux system)
MDTSTEATPGEPIESGRQRASAGDSVKAISSARSRRDAAVPASPAAAPASPDVQELVEAPKGRRYWVPIIAIVLLSAVAAATVSFIAYGRDLQTTNDAYVEGRVIRISPRVSGQVIRLNVDDNTPVKAGDVLLEIDPADFQAKVDQSSAALAQARSSVEQAKAAVLSADAAVGEAQAALRAAEADANRRRSDYRRYAAMGTDGVSAQQLDTAQAAADSADAQRDAAAKKLNAAQAQLNVAKTNVATAESQVAGAEAQLHFAELQLQYTKVLAPESGRVTKKAVEAGWFVSAGQPLLSVVPDDAWVIANFKEVQLEWMRVGQPVAVRVDAFPDVRFRARVQSLQAGTGSRFQLLPPENATGNWVKVVQRLPVKIVFEPGQAGLARLAQGMSVEVSVDTRRSDEPKEAR